MPMAEKKKLSCFRHDLLTWVGQALIGPGFGLNIDEPKENILYGINPLDRYHTAILFPVIPGESGIDPASEDTDEYQDFTDDNPDTHAEPLNRKRRYTPPSSVGFSFFIKGTTRLQLIPEGVGYTTDSPPNNSLKDIWTRFSLCDFSRESFTVECPKSRETTEHRKPVFEDKGELHVLWRPFADGWMTTVSLINKQVLADSEKPKEFAQDRCALSFFEVRLKCVVDQGDVGVYPRVDPELLTDEEMELELQYRDRRTYAVGHGAAVNWTMEEERIREIRSDFLPAVEVPQVTADVDKGGSDVLDIAVLSRYTFGDPVIHDLLVRFVSDYESWILSQKNRDDNFNRHEKEAAFRIIQRMDTALYRMRRGLDVLEKNRLAAMAFAIANQAMHDQMATYDKVLGKTRTYRWRPFQLAFILVSLESVVHEDSEFRDLVDLIWFPTGGGKTEAYLALIAFLITYRRLAFPSSSGGTTVLMRYTLRLLTAQQFERACRLICSLEMIRRNSKGLLGKEPITAGMWVGQASSPNTFREAMDEVRGSVTGSGEPPRSLILSSCPRCGRIFNVKSSYISNERSFRFRCVNPECDFGKAREGFLPCQVVDEALYENPPTLVISTIDKFARLAWDERTTAFFGLHGNRPPEMIIQDELHLISGALGSVAGLYEAALDTVLISKGVRPKYIASTATIKMAEQQVRRLYARDLAVFPPPGLSCDDSYFARTVPLEERPGRLYAGYLAPLKNRQHCMAPLAGALLAGPEMVFREQADKDLLFDAWWTMVVYHGSLKGVGNSQNAFRDDVPKNYSLFRRDGMGADVHEDDRNRKEKISRRAPEVSTLTSVSKPEENRRTFDRLEKRYDEAGYLDAVLATNMVSVGLDVSRLSLMIINGQPLTTAEYIQASSRVGRSDVPGLVFVNYYRDQARSLSHYEDFRSYHESFYRFVEPTSITPYTYQARMRALHAAMVIAVRHSCEKFLTNTSAMNFDPSDLAVATVLQRLGQRCAMTDAERAKETTDHIKRLASDWKLEADRCKADKKEMFYSVKDTDRVKGRLLYNHQDRIKGLWPTLQSMRNVENSALMVLL